MTRTRLLATAALLVLSLLGVAAAAAAEALSVGDRAPDFELRGSDGQLYRLSDFVGKRGVVLAWFPKAFTPGWSRELAALRDSAKDLAEYQAAVFMVSLDSPEKNRAFAEALEADLVLLSDPGGRNATSYGVKALAGLYSRRWTFYIDRQGVIRAIDKEVQVDSAGQDIARTLGELGFPKKGGPESGAPEPNASSEPAESPGP